MATVKCFKFIQRLELGQTIYELKFNSSSLTIPVFGDDNFSDTIGWVLSIILERESVV